MTAQEEILQKLIKIEGILSKSQTKVPDDVIVLSVFAPIGVLIILNLLIWGIKSFQLKTKNELELVDKKGDLFWYGFNHSLFVTGLLMLYAGVLVLNDYNNTSFISVYNLAATTAVGFGISLALFSETNISTNIQNKKMKDYIRNMGVDDISNLKKIDKQISKILKNKINTSNIGNFKNDLTKVQSDIKEILRNHQ
ncbi:MULTISPECIES: hypothetical protein [Bacillus cereus group]|uniref:Uncharacterized protein n=1 Tax=Bacillus thuringiensis TaxID=1428 RepID=A0A1C4DGR8_BACTU|nr:MULTISPECIES: hypothetical protein [Bacillus cereus group]MED3025263.1 hypothetical protein [Bacillus wiedmannii]OTX98322.1 hypothetical protein BK729_13775 [Bacillus thuringiensis serovar wratislaviensis]OUB53489.1 hypothetical protein BK743_28815 [Bacillus thuringiensis serovar sylvestriensis]SCC30400.1 Protein of unknown function [Bacillus thuringiensis]